MKYQQGRRSGRISQEVPILLLGSDSKGRIFSEETKTVVLSFHGAGVVSTHKLIAEQELILRSLETNREAEVRVVGEIGAQADSHTYGVALVDETLDFWKMNFSPRPSLKERPAALDLECSICHTPIFLEHGEFEFDICAIHGGLVRCCDSCAMATVWKQTASILTAPEISALLRRPRHTRCRALFPCSRQDELF